MRSLRLSFSLPAPFRAKAHGLLTLVDDAFFATAACTAASCMTFGALLRLALLLCFVMLIKHGTGQLRPDGSDRLSFPSAHAAMAAYCAALACAAYRGAAPRAAAIAWAALVAMSRVALRRHSVRDVIVGALCGCI